MTIMTELDELIRLVEAQIPANPNGPLAERSSLRLEKLLQKYFRSLEHAFPFSRLDALVNKYTESIESDAEKLVNPILSVTSGSFKTQLEGELTTIYVEGQAEMTSYGKSKMGVPKYYEGPPMRKAVSWAKTRGSQLVTEMDATTKKRLAGVISNGIQNKRGVPGIARDIRGTFSDMTKYRSELISKTETRNALFSASQASMEDMGISGKEWVLGAGGLSGNCKDCIANAAQGIIPVSSSFSTPQGSIHPGCTCAIAPAKLKK